jgi:hypothetical protein
LSGVRACVPWPLFMCRLAQAATTHQHSVRGAAPDSEAVCRSAAQRRKPQSTTQTRHSASVRGCTTRALGTLDPQPPGLSK